MTVPTFGESTVLYVWPLFDDVVSGRDREISTHSVLYGVASVELKRVRSTIAPQRVVSAIPIAVARQRERVLRTQAGEHHHRDHGLHMRGTRLKYGFALFITPRAVGGRQAL